VSGIIAELSITMSRYIVNAGFSLTKRESALQNENYSYKMCNDTYKTGVLNYKRDSRLTFHPN